VRDDVGTAVDLLHVEKDVVAARLVDPWVVATGRAILNQAGRLRAVEGARVNSMDDPTAHRMRMGRRGARSDPEQHD